jgi:predicted DCC family thiol-disulfide oxidoreductase YuxK
MSSSQKNLVADLPDGKALVLFDGYCNLCNGAVQFILKRDKKEHFYFASLSWPVAEPVLQSSDELKDVDSIILYDGERVYTRSSAALRISSYMGGLWPLFNVFWIMPKFFRDPVYNFIARNRYKWFGKKDTCMMPDSDVSHRFLNEKRPT